MFTSKFYPLFLRWLFFIHIILVVLRQEYEWYIGNSNVPGYVVLSKYVHVAKFVTCRYCVRKNFHPSWGYVGKTLC